MSKLFFKKGFGLIEVMIAAVVLGFLIVGLTRLQMGNRETILRVRDRDAANFIAQHVLDSISALGKNAFIKNECKGTDEIIVHEADDYEYKFEGKDIGESNKGYKVVVSCVIGAENNEADYTTDFKSRTEIISHSLKARVSWKHRDSEQAITIVRVVK
jgi:prepilin-type N-terminal cleavage/methylation domain-containing protein